MVFATDAFRLKDAKGLRYLAYLLQRPGHEVHVLDLAAVEAGAAADRPKVPPTRDDELHRAGSPTPGPSSTSGPRRATGRVCSNSKMT